MCPTTTDPDQIAIIDDQFAALYAFMHLPGSLKRLRQSVSTTQERSSEPPEDKMGLLRWYLAHRDANLLEALSDPYDVVMIVDWREQDDAIVEYCETCLKTGQLSAEVKDSNNPIGFDVIITYKGEPHRVEYAGKGSDRDTTIVALNQIIEPEYEIRFWKPSDGDDTLVFLPLSSRQWTSLEIEYGHQRVDECFAKINPGSRFFG